MKSRPRTASQQRVAAVSILGATSALAPGLGLAAAQNLSPAYSQNFDTLIASGSAAFVDDGTIAGWYSARTGTGATIVANDGSSNAGALYSYGTGTNAERALGTLGSGNAAVGNLLYGVRLVNNSADVVTALSVSYAGEQWRNSAAVVQTVDFTYQIGAAGLNSGAWTDVNALDFTSPVTGGTAGALNGNTVTNRATISGTISGLSLAPGQEIWLRWADIDHSGADHGLAIDDLSVTPTFSSGGDEPPAVVGTTPANGATAVPVNANIAVSFSEPVTAGGDAFALSCATSGPHTFALSSSGNTVFTLNPDADFANGEICVVTVAAAGVSDLDGTPDSMAADYFFSFTVATGGGAGLTPIYQIQGGGAASPMIGQTKTTSGVVTRINNNGFFIQDQAGDGNAATSDGILVFTGFAPAVSTGDLVQLSGTVAEFNTGASSNADTLAHPVTELTVPTGITVLSTGNTINPVAVPLPEAVNDDLERYEGMLVTLNGPLTASQNFFQGRYGQVTLSANGRLENPTNKYRPGTAEAIALADEDARRRILLDDGTSLQNPNPTPYIGADNTLRAGDTVASVTGVIDYGLATNDNTKFGDYKIHPTQAVSFARANARTAAPEAVGGNLKVASFNVLNYFTTFTNGTTAFGQTGQGCSLDGAVSAGNCRGADSSAEFTRQRTKIVAAIQAIDADVVGLMEIQNNGNTAAQNLVDGLNAAMGAGTYAVLPLPPQGTGTDAIRVAMIYKPASVTLAGSSFSDTDAIHDRPPLGQTFAAPNGQPFTVVVNHLKSKGSCPAGSSDVNADQGDGQGCWNNRRLLQAQRLRTWVAANAGADALLIGDLNAYGREDPIDDLASHGYVDVVGAFNSFGYSYVFDGAAGRLDHALATASLSTKVAAVKLWHINADEPSIIDYNLEFKQPACGSCGPDYYTATAYRSSDHDPVVVGLNLNDLDGDGLSDAIEALLGTNPNDLDSDDDGIPDGTEDANHDGVVGPGETNPANADTDGDGIQDGTELGYSAGVADPDGAGPLLGTNPAVFVPDADPATTSSPWQADTDGDGYNDGVEDPNHNGRVDAGEYDPLSSASFPPAQASVQVPMLPGWAMVLFGVVLAAMQWRMGKSRGS